MANTPLNSSAKMAIVMGIFLPIAETIRRIDQVIHFRAVLSWFDDYILGAVLLVAAFMVLKNKKNATSYLIAAWGIATGALFLSFLGQFSYYNTPAGDPGIFSTTFVAIAKGVILMYMLIGLLKAIKGNAQFQKVD